MIREAREVHLSRKDRKVLEECCRSPVTLQRDLKRARIVLLAAAGRSTPVDSQGSWGPAADCQPLAASLYRAEHRHPNHCDPGSPVAATGQDRPLPPPASNRFCVAHLRADLPETSLHSSQHALARTTDVSAS